MLYRTLRGLSCVEGPGFRLRYMAEKWMRSGISRSPTTSHGALACLRYRWLLLRSDIIMRLVADLVYRRRLVSGFSALGGMIMAIINAELGVAPRMRVHVSVGIVGLN